MFSSLDRVDLVYTGPDGRTRWLQSDHRRPAEVEAEAELSLIFALIRLLDPRRDFPPDGDPPVLEYRCQHMPPTFLRVAIASAGAELFVDAPVPFDGVAPDPGGLARLALAALADRVARAHGVACDLAGLAQLEREQPTLAPDADEVSHSRAVVQLAAFAGEILRTHAGGHWTLGVGADAGVFPFVFAVDGHAVLDLFAVAIDRVTGDEPVEILAIVEAAITARTRPGDAS